MLQKIKMLVVGIVLIACVLNNIGCAAGWFLAGAGVAATAVVVSEEMKNPETEPEPIPEKQSKQLD